MFESGKKKGTVQRQRIPAARTPQPVVVPKVNHAALQRSAISAATFTPVSAQAQAIQPIMRASELHQAEVQRLSVQRQALQQQAQSLPPVSASIVEAALQRQQAVPAPPPLKPQSNADWVTVMRFQAQQAEGRNMSTRELSQFTALQRQVTQTLTQSYLRDRQPALQRQQEYAGHLASLQRHPISGMVAYTFMRSIPSGERPALQRAVDEVMQRQAERDAQDRAALQHHSIQRQLAELEQEAAMPVMQRIQERRGAGNPLPEAVQRHLEQGLNHDLSSVRIHDDAEADKLAKGVNAVAFTTGRDIYFQSGKFNPNTQTGLELLAHEVTHTVQQAQGKVGKGVDPDSGLESEARQMGRKLATMKASGAKISARKAIQRAPLRVGHAVQRQRGAGLVGDPAEIAKLEKQLKNLNNDMKLTMVQAAADVAGIVDPTPISDGISAAISLYRGDFLGAGLSIISMIPGVGDAVGKPLKGSKIAKRIAQLEKEIKTVTQQLAKAKGVDLMAVQKAVNASKQVVKTEILKLMPKNWTQVSKIIGKKYNKSLLPKDYYEKIINGKPAIFRNPGKADDALVAPLAIDGSGKIILKQASDRLSDPVLMRANFRAKFGRDAKAGHQIHHLVPDNLIQSHPLGQAAEKLGVSLDRGNNLFDLPGKAAYQSGGNAGVGHWSSHPKYDALVTPMLNTAQKALEKTYGSLDAVPKDVMEKTMDGIAAKLLKLIEKKKVPLTKDGRLAAAPSASSAEVA